MKKLLAALLMLTIFIVSGCAENTKTKKVDANGAPKLTLNLCSSMSEAVTKLLVDDYSKKQGVEVKVKYLPEGSFAEKWTFCVTISLTAGLVVLQKNVILLTNKVCLVLINPTSFIKCLQN